MQHAAEMYRCLEQADVAGVRRLWAHVAPHMPQPKTDAEALSRIHYARTTMPAMALKLRAYSHRWLLDHGYPSGLPDDLKAKCERMYPVVIDAVGIACGASSEILKPAAAQIETAMSDAVMDAYADKKTDPVFVKARMMDARARMKKYFRDLFGEASARRPMGIKH